MKKIYVVLICVLLSVSASSQSFIGAWEGYHESEKGVKIKTVVTFAEARYIRTKKNNESFIRNSFSMDCIQYQNQKIYGNWWWNLHNH